MFGTSASSPVVGSLITLINDARLAAGKGSVGKCSPCLTIEGVLIVATGFINPAV